MNKTKKATRLLPVALAAALAVSSFAVIGNSSISASAASVDTVNGTYTSSYSSLEEAKIAGAKLNLQIAEEGMVLLKNDNNALPLVTGKGTQKAKVSVFGYASLNPAGGGDVSGGETSGGVVNLQSDIYSSLADAGFEVNAALKNGYETAIASTSATSDWELAHTPTKEAYTYDYYGYTMTGYNTTGYATKGALDLDSFADSYKKYDDAAIVVLTEGDSNLVGSTLTGVDDSKLTHSLQIDDAQIELVKYASEHFDKVILLINSSNPIEIGEAVGYADAVLLVGEPGDNGFDALGEILNGTVTPSGRTSDSWAADFTKDPSYVNYNTTGSSTGRGTDGAGNTTGYGQYTVDGESVKNWYVDYEEGIYVGYRYYETRGYEENKTSSTWDWYNSSVTYTFGYGLSYTEFEWEVTPVKAEGAITATDTLKFDVKVTNVGDYSGKEVVQLYYSAPYTVGGIEKSYVNLGDYTKTNLLAPGESQTVRVSIDVGDMSSYDYKVNKSYVLEDGEYNLILAHDAHTATSAEATYTYTVAEDVAIRTSSTGYTVTNRFDDVTDEYLDHTDKQLSRADFAGTMPTVSAETIALTATEYKAWQYDNADDQDETLTASSVTYADAATRPATATLTLYDMIGADANDERWDTLVEQLTLEELQDLVNGGGFHSIALDYIGKPYSFDTDGPKGWTGSGAGNFNSFAAEPVIASTFNKELAYEMGVMIGEQGLWGNSGTDGMTYNYTGWYAPGMNIHRSPFDSRYTEYYSEDPVLTGQMAANASLGAKSMGAYVCIKHFAFHNDGGGVSTYRMGSMMSGTTSQGLSAWMDEQTAREIYLKGYQIAVEDGEATFAMASFTRIGTTWCGGSYALNTEILRNEWGFDGAIVTDICIYNSLNAYQFINAGGDMMLATYAGTFIDASDTAMMTPTNIKAMQEAAKHICYMVANSNAMQQPVGSKVIYSHPTTTNASGDTVLVEVPKGTSGSSYSFDASGATLNTYGNYGRTISYSMTGAPAGLKIDATTGVISGTPTESGTFEVAVTASATGYESATVTYEIVVASAASESTVTVDELQDKITELETKVAELEKTSSTSSESKSSGCSGSADGIYATIAALAAITTAAVAVRVIRKKREEK